MTERVNLLASFKLQSMIWRRSFDGRTSHPFWLRFLASPESSSVSVIGFHRVDALSGRCGTTAHEPGEELQEQSNLITPTSPLRAAGFHRISAACAQPLSINRQHRSKAEVWSDLPSRRPAWGYAALHNPDPSRAIASTGVAPIFNWVPRPAYKYRSPNALFSAAKVGSPVQWPGAT